MSETELASHSWWEHYKETVNSDPEMRVRGHDRFDENFYVEIGDERFLIVVDGGRVEEVVPDPGMNRQWAFGVEGDREAWNDFVRETPSAFNHEVIASNYRTTVRNEPGHLEITGDNKRVFQNLRPFQRALDLMREAHNDGGNL